MKEKTIDVNILAKKLLPRSLRVELCSSALLLIIYLWFCHLRLDPALLSLIKLVTSGVALATILPMTKLQFDVLSHLRSGMPWSRFILKKIPIYWQLFSLLLPRKVRTEIYDPAYNDMLVDHLLALKKYRGKWVRLYLLFAFGIRTIFMITDCVRVSAQDKTFQLIKSFFGSAISQLLRK